MKDKTIKERWRDHTRTWFQSLCTYRDFNMKVCKDRIDYLFKRSNKIIYAEGPIDAGIINTSSDRDIDNIDNPLFTYCNGTLINLWFLDYPAYVKSIYKVTAKTGLSERQLYRVLINDRYLFGFVRTLELVMEYKFYSKYTPVLSVGIDSALLIRFWDFCLKNRYLSNREMRQHCRFVINSGIFMILSTSVHLQERTTCILKAPKYINLNSNSDLHCIDGPAIQWADGYSLYFLNGVPVSKELAETSAQDLDPIIILDKKNPLLRREIINKIGIQKVIDRLGAKQLNGWRGYELLELQIPDMDIKPLYLKMKNPSTGQIHIEGVSPNVKTCKEALAWRDGEEKYILPEEIT